VKTVLFVRSSKNKGGIKMKPINRKCPVCGGENFSVPYVERAWEKCSFVDGELVRGEDGELDEHESDLTGAFCRGCNTEVDLSDFEDEFYA
jgi:hypothetical protein